MGTKKAMRLSAGEMEIMAVLWRLGSATLSQTHEAFGRPIGYTTIQTRLNRLVEKGIVRRSSSRPAEYQPSVKPEQVGKKHLDLLLERIGGSIVPMVAHLLSSRAISKSEFDEIRKLIAEAEGKADRSLRKEKSP